jgi:hypothetical protein
MYFDFDRHVAPGSTLSQLNQLIPIGPALELSTFGCSNTHNNTLQVFTIGPASPKADPVSRHLGTLSLCPCYPFSTCNLTSNLILLLASNTTQIVDRALIHNEILSKKAFRVQLLSSLKRKKIEKNYSKT